MKAIYKSIEGERLVLAATRPFSSTGARDVLLDSAQTQRRLEALVTVCGAQNHWSNGNNTGLSDVRPLLTWNIYSLEVISGLDVIFLTEPDCRRVFHRSLFG